MREAAQPLLTLLDGPARVELSGATTANWVAKSANLLVDGLGSPARVGLLLPLHWQGVALLLAGVATGATVVVAADADGLVGCDAAFVTGPDAQAALDAGVDAVLALSGHPLGAPLAGLPPAVEDYAREVPSYADHWGGPAPVRWVVSVAGTDLGPLPSLPVGGRDRVLVAVEPADPEGLAGLLAVLTAGAALLLAPDPDSLDLAAVAAGEGLTCSLGVDVPGLPRLDPPT